jgi:hypothetical protein
MQHFSSFLALIGLDDPERFAEALAVLPHTHHSQANLRQWQRSGMRLAWYPAVESPLNETILIEHQGRVLLLQGDFYAKPQIGQLEALMHTKQFSLDLLREVLANLNGSFSGVILLPEQIIISFTDPFGFNFCYYAADQERRWAASSIWPLLRVQPGGVQIDPASVEDIILLGYPTGDRTIHRHIATLQPGRIAISQPGHPDRIQRYTRIPERRPLSPAQADDRFRAAFRAHFGYVSERLGTDQFVATITGGHDTRVVLNAALVSGIYPTCVTGTDDPTWPTEDAMRAMRVAAVAGCKRSIIPYTRSDVAHGPDSYILSEGGGTGLWMATLAEESMRYGRALYCGFTGDVLSGSPETVNPRMYSGLDPLAYAVFMANYEYRIPATALANELLGTNLDHVLGRYRATFEPYQGADLRDATLFQNLDNRNFRRIAYFAAAIKRSMPAVSLYHDRLVAEAYLELPDTLLADERMHRRLCALANPRLGAIPANQWMVPMAFEPLFWNYVRGPAKKVFPTLLEWRAKLRKSAPRTELDPRYQPALALLKQANLLDLERVERMLVQEPYDGRGHILAFRLELLAKLAIVAQGGVIGELSSATVVAAD